MPVALDDDVYRKAVVESMDGILITVPDGRILYANPAACRMLGRSEEQIRELGRQKMTDADDPRWRALLEERGRTGRVRGVAPMVRADGTSFLAEIASSIFSQPDGSERSVVVFRDVTVRVHLEQRLRASNDVTHALLAGEPTTDVLVRVAHHARTLLEASDAAVITPAWEPGSVVVRAAEGERVEPLVGRIYSGSLAAQVMESKRTLVVEDLTEHALSEDGRAIGLGPAIVVPIVSKGRAFGNLLVGAPPGSRGYNGEDCAIVESFAEAAGVALALGTAREESESRQRQTAAQLQTALESRVLIEQAKGIISASRGISVDEAFDRLRSYARAHSTKLHEVAAAVSQRRLLP